MKRYNSAGGLRTLLFFILFINMFGFNASGKKLAPKVKGETPVAVSTFENPDFAIPADVIKDAGKVFTASLKAGNSEKALKAAMQMAAADALISSDSIATILKRYEEVEEMSGTPWKNLAALLQSKQLTASYSEDRWDYDRRMLPAEDLNENPLLWSGAQFKNRIVELCTEALADSERLGGTDLSTIGGVLTGLESGNPAHYSVLDFIVYQVIEIYNRSNLGDSGVEIAGDIAPAKLIDRLIAADDSFMSEADIKDGGSEALLRARLAKLTYSRGESNNGLYDRSVAELLKLYPVGNPRRGELIAALDSRGKFNTTTLDRKRELFHLISDVKDDKDADVKKYLKSIIDRLMQPEYSVSSPGQWLTSGDTVKINAYNIADGYLLMVPISATQAEGNRVRNQELKATGKVKVIAHIRNDVSEPVENNPAVAVDDVAPGYYAFVMSRTDALAGMFEEEKQDYPNVILVSDLSCFATTDARLQKLPDSGNRKLKPADKYLYVVNGRNNVPVRGATVVFTNTNYYKRQEKTTLVTDNGGKVLLPYDHCMAVITSGKDRLLWEGSKGYSPAEQATHLNGSIFTDLAIYHPGDTVKLAVVATSTDGKTVAVAPEKDLTVKFFDANYQEISSEKVKTDKYGRTETAFTIPTDGLTGRFTLRVLADERIIGSTSVEVADYKVPSFRVNLDNPEVASSGEELSNGEKKIVLTGVVMTYSGVPVAGAEVTLDVNFDPWWSRWMIEAPAEDEFGATATTDATGRFKAEVTLPATDDTSSYNFGRFYATATATSPAGETQTSLRKGFAVGEGFTLKYEGKNEVEVTKDKIDVRVQVTDLLGEPAMKELDFSLTQCDYSGEKEVSVVDKGSFKSPVLTLDAAKIASGVYKLRVVLPQAMKVSKGNQTEWEADTLEQELIFWRSGDKRPPLATAVWTPERVYYAKPGESQVDVTVGSGYEDEWLYMQIADGKGTRSREWLRPAGKNMTIKVKAPEAGECVSLYFVGCHNLKQESPVIRVLPAEANKTTLFKVDTFRDRIVPGDKETWKFR
ncbi:MAG: hypothetical protein K2K29_04885, partial [Muribaculaceae bacterium]|nr:hypothetical protein [Muribaculaceae bacterium]